MMSPIVEFRAKFFSLSPTSITITVLSFFSFLNIDSIGLFVRDSRDSPLIGILASLNNGGSGEGIGLFSYSFCYCLTYSLICFFRVLTYVLVILHSLMWFLEIFGNPKFFDISYRLFNMIIILPLSSSKNFF